MELINRVVVIHINISVEHVLKVLVRPASNTIFYDLRTNEKTIILSLKMILKGMSLHGVVNILEAKLDTVRRWLRKAADHMKINNVLLNEIEVDKIELDEL
jgi:hypothetical protein